MRSNIWKWIWMRYEYLTIYHYDYSPMQHIANLNGFENDNFQLKILNYFLVLLWNIDWRYFLEPPLWGSSNIYPQSMFWAKNEKNIIIFHLKYHFVAVKNCSILHTYNCNDLAIYKWASLQSLTQKHLTTKLFTIIVNEYNHTIEILTYPWNLNDKVQVW